MLFRSPMTVPFIMALGVGIAAIRNDDNAADDSFGLVAMCSVGPILAVLILALIYSPSGSDYVANVIPQLDTSVELGRMFSHSLPHYMGEIAISLLPIVIFFGLFQIFSLRLKGRRLGKIIIGLVYTYVGLVLFLAGANVGFMPAGSYLGSVLAGSQFKYLLIPIGSLIGFFIVKAEPAVYVLNHQVEEITDGSISARMNENVHSKDSIAQRAAEFLETGRSIFIDSGSTLQHIVQYVPNERFTFTTTDPAAALELCKVGLPIVNIVGGRLDRDNQTITGLQATRFLADINIDIALLSPSGLSDRSGFTIGNYSECELKRIVVEKARLVVILMDASKIDKSLPYTFATFDEADVLITNAPLPPELSAQAAAKNVRVIDVSHNE